MADEKLTNFVLTGQKTYEAILEGQADVWTFLADSDVAEACETPGRFIYLEGLSDTAKIKVEWTTYTEDEDDDNTAHNGEFIVEGPPSFDLRGRLAARLAGVSRNLATVVLYDNWSDQTGKQEQIMYAGILRDILSFDREYWMEVARYNFARPSGLAIASKLGQGKARARWWLLNKADPMSASHISVSLRVPHD